MPGGLATTFFVLTGVGASSGGVCGSQSDPATGAIVETCTGGPSALRVALGIALSVFLLVAPFFTTVFLARRMRPPAGAAYQPSAGSA